MSHASREVSHLFICIRMFNACGGAQGTHR